MKMCKKRGKGIMILLCFLVLIAVIFELILPPGRTQPSAYSNTNKKSISEKTCVNINGSRQGMFIKGKSVDNPVLLFLNGGSGIPDYFLTKQVSTGLEDNFTVCYWDYRGTALSYSKDCKAEDCTTDQFVKDAVAVTDYLCKRFS